MFARLRVADYDRWRAAHEAFAETRTQYGERGYGVYTTVDDPHEVTVWQRFDDAAAARAFLDSGKLDEAIAEAGILGEPEIWLADDRD
jgi:quinol monooxygenase YgiN